MAIRILLYFLFVNQTKIALNLECLGEAVDYKYCRFLKGTPCRRPINPCRGLAEDTELGESESLA